jgi:cytochrome c biogenesis protein
MKGAKRAEPRRESSGSVFSEIAAFFTSVRTTIGLLFLLASTSVLGTVIPQDLSAEQISQAAGTFSSRLMVILDLHNVYRSWWFLLLLALMACNLLGCLLRRLPAIPAEWKMDERKHSFTLSFTDIRHQDALRNLIVSGLGPLMKAAPRVTETKGAVTLAWVKDRIHLLGFPLIHAGIIVIMLGGLVGLFLGFKGHLQIKEGDTASTFRTTPSGELKALPFSIAVDRFTLTRYPTGEPKEFRSDVRLLKEGTEVVKGSILVNHPLTLDRISLYQADYRVAGLREATLRLTDREGNERDLILGPQDAVELPGTRFRLHLVSVDPGTTKRGVGAEIQVRGPGDEAKVSMLYRKDREPLDLDGTKLRFADYAPLYATGLQVGYDPGTPLVWTGCLLLVIGFMLTLFTNHRALFVEFSTTGQGTAIRIWGRSKRLRREFRESVEQSMRGILDKRAEP